MRVPTLLAAIVSSSLVGALFVLACSDDSLGNADAAVCDCPAAEPPLPGRIQWVATDVTIPAMGQSGVTAACPVGAKLLGGGCGRNGETGFNVITALPFDVGAGQQAFGCQWRSILNNPAVNTATAICLVP